MTTPSTVTAAEYFAEENHIASATWFAFGETLRTAAEAQADRLLKLYLGATRSATDQADLEDLTDITYTDAYKYAVCEQALHILKASGAAMDKQNSVPAYIAPEGGEQPGAAGVQTVPTISPNDICPLALMYLSGIAANGKPRRCEVTIVRG